MPDYAQEHEQDFSCTVCGAPDSDWDEDADELRCPDHREAEQAEMPSDVHDTFWLGYRAGVRMYQYAGMLLDHEPALREELRLIGTTHRPHRAFALGELRGYRQAADRLDYSRPDRGMQVRS